MDGMYGSMEGLPLSPLTMGTASVHELKRPKAIVKPPDRTVRGAGERQPVCTQRSPEAKIREEKLAEKVSGWGQTAQLSSLSSLALRRRDP
jgi:hypothetical protein